MCVKWWVYKGKQYKQEETEAHQELEEKGNDVSVSLLGHKRGVGQAVKHETGKETRLGGGKRDIFFLKLIIHHSRTHKQTNKHSAAYL